MVFSAWLIVREKRGNTYNKRKDVTLKPCFCCVCVREGEGGRGGGAEIGTDRAYRTAGL